MPYIVRIFENERYQGGRLPHTQAGKALQEIRTTHEAYYRRIDTLFRKLGRDKSENIFLELMQEGFIASLPGAVSNDTLYEAKYPISKRTRGGVVRVYFALSRHLHPKEITILDAEYKTGDPSYTTAVQRLGIYRREYDKR